MTSKVLVVGGGPTGLCTAILLAQRGIEVVVIEKHPEPYPLPRAIHLDDETARLLQACGLSHAVATMTPGTSYEWRNGSGETLLRFLMSLDGTQGWPQANMFNQPVLEEQIRSRVRTLSLISLRFDCELLSFHQTPSQVTARVRSAGEVTEIDADYLVGADGANSTVRQLLGIEMEDHGFFFDWLVADLELHEDRIFEPSMLQICDPARPTTLMPGGLPHERRWEFMALPGETLEELVIASWLVGLRPGARVASFWREMQHIKPLLLRDKACVRVCVTQSIWLSRSTWLRRG
jgi:2-polyprenyl-6-methoxyphenol hydroxylase-like FAD-dependent oxidoreductase